MKNSDPMGWLGMLVSKLRRWPGVLWRLEARIKGVEFKGKCDILGRPMISIHEGGRIIIGDGVRLANSVRANPLGCFQPCALRAISPGASVVLGKNVGMSATVLCAGKSIEVGEGTIFGSGAMVLDNDTHVPEGEWGWSNDAHICSTIAKSVVIGRGVFVGARALILKGVTIGDRAIIGAGAVVTKDVPARHIAVGNPARFFAAKSATIGAATA